MADEVQNRKMQSSTLWTQQQHYFMKDSKLSTTKEEKDL